MNNMESYCKSVQWTIEEMNLMYQRFFCDQVGYKRIAKELHRSETHVRKQIAYLMSELVA